MLTSVVIPVYNESSCLEENLETVDTYLRTKLPACYEIVCVDDGSVDGSLAILESLRGRLPLTVQANGQNRGKGAAIRAGMLSAKGDRVFFFDADLSTPLSEVDRFLDHLDEGIDVVIGTRKAAAARIKRFQPPHRVIMGLGYTHLVNLMTGMRISDYTCGFKAFSRKAVDIIFPRSGIEGWSFDVEIIYLAHRFGMKILEVPVTWENRPGSKVRLFKDTFRSFVEIFKIKRMHRGAGS